MTIAYYDLKWSYDTMLNWLRPPEIRHERETHPATDIYYIGLIGIFLLSGNLLLGDLAKWIDEYHKSLYEYIQYLPAPPRALAILEKSVSTQVEHRFSNAYELLLSLRKINT